MLRIEYRATGAIDWLFAAHVGCSGTGVTENCPKVVGPDWAIPMSPMLKRRRDGRTLIVVSTKPGDVLALDAAQRGAPVWRMNVVSAPPVPAGEGNRGTAWGGALDDDNAYFGLNADGIAAVSLTDGTRVSYTPLNATADKKITHSAAATVIPGVVFIGGSDGRLWALSSRDGRSLWSYETAHAFDTVNAVPAHGGSMIAPGPTVAGGMVLKDRGTAWWQSRPATCCSRLPSRR